MFSIISCEAPSRRSPIFFKIRKSSELFLLGKKVRYLHINRSNRLVPQKLLEHTASFPTILSSYIPPKERQRLKNSGMRIFSCEQTPAFLQTLCLRTAIELFSLSGIPFPCQILGIVDPQFCHSNLSEYALCHLPQVHILTDNLDAAKQFSHRMMQEYGAPVLFSSNPELLANAGLVFSPDNLPIPTESPLLLPFVPSPDNNLPENSIIFHSPVPVLSPSLAGSVPADISAVELLSALYSLEKCSILKNTACHHLCRQTTSGDHMILTPYDAAGILLQRFREKLL